MRKRKGRVRKKKSRLPALYTRELMSLRGNFAYFYHSLPHRSRLFWYPESKKRSHER